MAQTYSCSFTQSRPSEAQGIVHDTMPGAITREDRRKSIIEAAKKWIDEHGNQTRGEEAAVERGTPISQQYLSWASRGEKIGPKMGDLVAALYDTTPDGLVYMFIRGGEWRPLRDVPGWSRAKSDARSDERAHGFEAWVWDAIDNVSVPARIRLAKPQMVLEIARFLQDWGRASSIRPKASAAR
jgi:hypothetical protein